MVSGRWCEVGGGRLVVVMKDGRDNLASRPSSSKVKNKVINKKYTEKAWPHPER